MNHAMNIQLDMLGICFRKSNGYGALLVTAMLTMLTRPTQTHEDPQFVRSVYSVLLQCSLTILLHLYWIICANQQPASVGYELPVWD